MTPGETPLEREIPSEREAERITLGRRVIRVELVIATFALLTSACASIAAIMQAREGLAQTQASIDEAHTVATQLGASVWPYLTIDDEFSSKTIRVTIANQGLGPALIRSLTISGPKGPIASIREMVNLIDSNSHRRSTEENSIGGGTVIRPSETTALIGITDKALDEVRARTATRSLRISVCYCSLLSNCWSAVSNAIEPKAVAGCGSPKAALAL